MATHLTKEARQARAKLGNDSFQFGQNSAQAIAARLAFDQEKYVSDIIGSLAASHPGLTPDQVSRLQDAIAEAALTWT